MVRSCEELVCILKERKLEKNQQETQSTIQLF